MERIDTRIITVPTQERLQEVKRELGDEGYREVPRKDEKDLKLNEYFVNELTIVYKVRIPEKSAKPL